MILLNPKKEKSMKKNEQPNTLARGELQLETIGCWDSVIGRLLSLGRSNIPHFPIKHG